MKDRKSLRLRHQPIRKTELNRTLLFFLGLFLILLIVFGIFSSLSWANRKNDSKKVDKINIEATTRGEVSTGKILENLPDSYQDRSKLVPFMTAAYNDELAKMVDSVSSLENKIKEMEGKLSKAKESNIDETQITSNYALTAAMTSPIYFNGLKPALEKLPKLSEDFKGREKNRSISKTFLSRTDYDRQNMQANKLSFLKNSAADPGDIYNKGQLTNPISRYELQAGTILPAALISTINTSLPGGVIIAQITSDIYDTVTGRDLLIPKGSKLIGANDSEIAYGQTKILVVFNRIIRPDGSSIVIDSTNSSSLSGAAGLNAKVNNHWGRIIGAAFVTAVTAGGSALLTNRNDSTDNSQTFNQGFSSGAAEGLSEVGTNITKKAINVAPELIAFSGTEFNVIIKNDMIVTPFHSNRGGLNEFE